MRSSCRGPRSHSPGPRPRSPTVCRTSPSLFRPRSLPDLGIDVALGFLAVGAGFALVDRLGIETGFSPAIVLLTATHFHFAGFGLLGITSLLARSRSSLGASVAGLIVGIPITAAGFVLHSDPIGAVGALFVGLAGIGVGLALVLGSRPDGTAWVPRLAGAALLVGHADGHRLVPVGAVPGLRSSTSTR